MPLHGKIVVIKRSGGDGTEFPLTATCLFGRKPDCDIRIQLPQVSKEHCRIDFNENKEIILTNLSSVNPTRVNGEALQQSERLKHGDVITVIDRSFRFEYPPASTPKKRSSLGAKTETFKVLQNQQVGDTITTETGEKGINEVPTDPHLKDGTNHENIQRPQEEDGLLQSKTASPFNDLYQKIQKSLDVKTPRKSSASVLQTPTSRFCTPKPASVRKNDDEKPVNYTEDEITPKKDEAKVFSIADETKEEAGNVSNETPKSVKKQPFQVPSTEMARPEVDEAENADQSEVTPQKSCTPPQRFTACEVVEQISASPKPPVRRTSPRNSGKVETVKETSKKRKREELVTDLPTSQMKRKRVSFGGVLCPELFDKRLPPDSPLCKGATPRRSLCVSKPRESLLRRASAMALLQTPTTGKTSPKSRSPSPKAATPAKKILKSKSPSPARGRSPTVQGRFSVSHISTPEDAVTEQVALVAAPLRKLCKRSGISRASMKVKNSWADIVRFGQTRAQVAAPAKKTVAKKTMKKTVSKPQDPARNLKGHVSTGHADSPVTIVVGRAHKQKVVHPTGAAPKLVTNISLFEKHMKMNEDLTGISEMLKTPGNEKRKTSVINETNAPKTLVGGLGTSVVEPSVLNTPEEPGEMMVSPLTVSSTVKDRSYNSEAVQRLFNNDKESGIVSDGPALGDSSEQQCTDLKTTSVATPKLKPELPECLTGVKRMMKTPRQKAEPIEDLRGRILKTPKQKPEEQECLTGVKRMMETPKQEAEPVEDIKVELLTTPEQQETLTEVERICKTPQPEAEPLEDQGKPLEAPKAETNEVADQAPLDCNEDIAKELVFAHEEPRDDVPTDVVHDVPTDVVHDVPTDVVHDVPTDVVHDVPTDAVLDVTTDVNDVPQVDIETEADANEVVVDDHLEELPSGLNDNQPSDAVEISQAAADENLCVEKPEEDTVDEKLSENQPDVEAATIKVTEMDTTATEESLVADAAEDCDEAVVPAPVRGRRGKKTEAAAPPTVRQTTRGRNAKSQGSSSDDQPEMAPEKALPTTLVTEISTEAVSDQTSPITENDSTPTEEEAVVKPARGRKSKQTPVEPPEPELNEVVGDKSLPEDAQPQKPRRGRKPKPVPVEQNEVVEDAVVAVETKQQSRAPVRAKRGRNAKQEEEEKLESASVETTKSQEPAKKLRRTRKAEQYHGEPREEVKAIEMFVPEETEAPLDAEPVKMEEQVAKPRRGGRKVPEVQEDAVVAVETKQQSRAPVRAKRGRNAKREEEEKLESASVETTKSQEPAKKLRRTRKAEQYHGEPREEVKAIEMFVPEETGAPLDAEPVKMEEQVAKPRRGGRKVPEVQEDAVVAVKTKQQSRATVRAKRGRNAKQEEEEKLESASVETTKSQKPAKKLRRTRKAEQDHGEPREEVKAIEMFVPEETGAPLDAEPVKMKEQVAKPRRGGRKVPEVQEDAVVAVKTKQQSRAPVRAKRGRNAKQEEEEKLESASVETTKSQKPAKKLRRTRKAEQDHGEPREEVKAIEMFVPEETGAPLDAEPVKMKEQVAKPRRGGRKVPEVQEDAVVAVKTKQQSRAPVRAKRGRNAKQEEEEKLESASVETTKSQKPAKKLRRTRKADQDHGEPREEVKAIEMFVPEETGAPLDAEPVKMKEQVAKPRRGGRKVPEVQEDAVVAVKTKQQSRAPVRAKRGRNAKQEEEEKLESASVETTKSQKPAKKLRRTRKADQDHGEPREEVKAIEMFVPEETGAPLDAEPVKMKEQVAKPRRGGRKVPEVQEVPADDSTDRLQKKNSEPVVKQSRARGTKTSVKNEVSQAVPAKKARRGAALPLEETNAESTVQVSEPASTSVEPAKRGRRAATKPPAIGATVASEPAKPTEDLSKAVVDTKTSKRSIKWKADFEVIPVKAVRGRKSKLGGQVDPESKTVSKAANKAQPVKGTRKGPKVTDVTAEEAVSTSKVESVEAEPKKPTEDLSKAVVDTKTSKRSIKWKADFEVIPVKAVRGRKSKLGGQVDPESKTVSKAANKAQPVKGTRKGPKVTDVTAEEAVSTSKVESVEAEPKKPTEDLSKAVVDTKTSKRSIKWKADFEVIPVKAVRGRKSKLGGQVDPESKTVSKAANKAQPVKGTRKGPKVTDVTAEEAVSTSKVESVEAEPKTRRGRSAKK